MANNRAKNRNGKNWIREEKRMAIYLRDGLACCYCGEGIEDGATLRLDHLTPPWQGGNDARNLVTACKRCNSSRGARDWREFAHAVAGYLNHGVTGEEIIQHIEATQLIKLDVAEAKTIIKRRGGFTAALKG